LADIKVDGSNWALVVIYFFALILGIWVVQEELEMDLDIELMKKVVEKDPTDRLAWLGLADTLEEVGLDGRLERATVKIMDKIGGKITWVDHDKDCNSGVGYKDGKVPWMFGKDNVHTLGYHRFEWTNPAIQSSNSNLIPWVSPTPQRKVRAEHAP
jgi:hypothetical protein